LYPEAFTISKASGYKGLYSIHLSSANADAAIKTALDEVVKNL
jgi:hypothetical protein